MKYWKNVGIPQKSIKYNENYIKYRLVLENVIKSFKMQKKNCQILTKIHLKERKSWWNAKNIIKKYHKTYESVVKIIQNCSKLFNSS